MEKTISYLNGKVWYRVLKVIYLFSFLFVFIGAIWVENTNGIREIDQSRSLITCNTGTKAQFSAEDAGVEFGKYLFNKDKFDYEYFVEFTSTNLDKIIAKCGIDNIAGLDPVIYNYLKDTTIDKEKREYVYKELDSGTSVDELKKAIVTKYPGRFMEQQFEVKVRYSYLAFIESFALTLLVVVVVFEIIRRTFYYIALGTLNPKQ